MSTLLSSQRFQKTVQLMLVVVLLVATFAFLPQPAAAADQAAQARGNGGAGTLTAKLDGRKITISGTNFNKSREFIVNVRSGKNNGAKLGTLKSSDAGTFRSTFTLPDKITIVKNLSVCVKDTKNNKRTCVILK